MGQKAAKLTIGSLDSLQKARVGLVGCLFLFVFMVFFRGVLGGI